MKNFNLGALSDWRPVGAGEVFDLAVPESKFRKCQFELMASDTVNVYVVTGDQSYLVARGDGLLEVKFVIDQDSGMYVEALGGADCYLRSHVETQVIPEPDDPSFTSIEPRPAGPSDDVRRMMRLMQLNQKNNERKLTEQFERRMRALEESGHSARDPEAGEVGQDDGEKAKTEDVAGKAGDAKGTSDDGPK